MKIIFLKNNTIFHLLVILVTWLIASVIINPIGEFPFGDDWAYYKPVKDLVETGLIKITDWSSMTLIGHILWGSVISEIFCFSFSVLRISIVFLGFAGLAGYYYLLDNYLKDKQLCLGLSVLFGFNPVFTLHSYSYYTDISFFTFFIWCIFFFTKFLDSNKTIYFILSVLFLIIAFSIRDLALIAVPAFILALLIKYKFSRKALLNSVLLIIVSLAVYFTYRYWIIQVHGMPMNQDFVKERLLITLSNPLQLIKEYSENSYMAFLSLGFYLAPVLIFLFWRDFLSSSKVIKIVSLIFVCLFVTGMLGLANIYPRLFIKSCEMVLGTLGTNEVIERVNAAMLFELPKNLKILFLTFGFFGMSLLLFIISKRIFSIKMFFKDNLLDFKFSLIFLIIIFYLVVIFTQNLFTRYLIPIYALFPILIVAISVKSENLGNHPYLKFIAAFLMLFYMYLGVSNPRDNLEFNRQRWQSAEYLMKEFKLTPEDIDGGFEFNAWYYYVPVYMSPPGKNWWWVINDDYSVAPGYIKGYEIIKVNTFSRFFPPCYEDSVFALKKIKN